MQRRKLAPLAWPKLQVSLEALAPYQRHFDEGGIKGDAHSKRFKVTFEDVYHQKKPQCPWYVGCGQPRSQW
jgi:hypothetical protein